MEVMVTTGAISRANLRLYRHHQQTNTQLFTGHALPVAQPTVWKHRLLSYHRVAQETIPFATTYISSMIYTREIKDIGKHSFNGHFAEQPG